MSEVIEMKKNKVGIFEKVAVGASAMGASVMAFAVDHSEAITTAATSGTTNVTAAVGAVIGLAGVVLGVGIVMRLLSR